MSSIEILLKAPVTEKAGNENKAFEIVQDLQHPFVFWIHAYQQCKEPDLFNPSFQ
jgi:hypothetical protein